MGGIYHSKNRVVYDIVLTTSNDRENEGSSLAIPWWKVEWFTANLIVDPFPRENEHHPLELESLMGKSAWFQGFSHNGGSTH